jgi:hypothetical protein
MARKATAGVSLVPGKDWNSLILDEGHLSQIAGFVRSAERPLSTQALAQALAEQLVAETVAASDASVSVKRYDHRCDYQEGERVFVDNRYGKSLASITKIIRQPQQAFCDKAFLEFDDAGYRTRWEEERSTPYFAINSGRANAAPTYIEIENTPKAAHTRGSRINATTIAKLSRIIERDMPLQSRFVRLPEGWQLAERCEAPALGRPHIQAEPGGAATEVDEGEVGPLPQGCYKETVLTVIDKMGEASIDEIKRSVQAALLLGPADWETDPTGKIVWIHRLHAAIKHLKRVGAIDSPRRELYRRVNVRQRETA